MDEVTEVYISHCTWAWQNPNNISSDSDFQLPKESLCLNPSQGQCQGSSLELVHHHTAQVFPKELVSTSLLLKEHPRRGQIRQKHWIPWAKWDRITVRRKAAVHTSPEKFKHMPNFQFLTLWVYHFWQSWITNKVTYYSYTDVTSLLFHSVRK